MEQDKRTRGLQATNSKFINNLSGITFRIKEWKPVLGYTTTRSSKTRSITRDTLATSRYKALKLAIPKLGKRIYTSREINFKCKEADYSKSLTSPLLASWRSIPHLLWTCCNRIQSTYLEGHPLGPCFHNGISKSMTQPDQ